jgi:hypothetical protein
MNVGVNYAWPCNHWSSFVGLEQGKLEPGYQWRESLPRNFAQLQRIGVSAVRIWLFANGGQYGNQPRLSERRLRRRPASSDYEFDPPEEISQAYLDRIHFLCDSADNTGLQLIPVLFDFGVFAGLDTAVLKQNTGGGRVNIAINDNASSYLERWIKSWIHLAPDNVVPYSRLTLLMSLNGRLNTKA